MSETAEKELLKELRDGETIESVVFGPWGWGSAPKDGEPWELGYSEPVPPPVPFEKRGVVLSWDEAAPLMRSWTFDGGYGAPEAYAVRIWTNQRIFWVTQYDGSTRLDSTARNPPTGPYMPDMPGG